VRTNQGNYWQLQSDLVYPNYFVLSNNVGLARYPENWNQTSSHGGHSVAIPPKLFCAPPNFVLPRKFFIKKYNKNRSLDPLKMFVPSKPLDQATGLA